MQWRRKGTHYMSVHKGNWLYIVVNSENCKLLMCSIIVLQLSLRALKKNLSVLSDNGEIFRYGHCE